MTKKIKHMKRIKNTVCLLVLFASTALLFAACKGDYTGKYEMTDGNPTIYYVRPTNAEYRDSLLIGAVLGETVCVVGDNLTSVQEVYFNDKQAILNINLVTKNTLIVTIPKDLPGETTDKIYFVTKTSAKTEFDFKVYMPTPVVRRIVCEKVAPGEDVVITGDYFFDDDPENTPLKVKVGTYDVPDEDIVSIDRYSITFKAPPIDVTGKVQVQTMYGMGGKSVQIFRDDRGLITGFEEGIEGGWGRPAVAQFQEDPKYAITGKYLVFQGNLDPSGNPAYVTGYDEGMIANIWQGGYAKTDPLFDSDPAKSILRFEAYVVEPWSAGPMVFGFDAAGTNETFVWADGDNPHLPRGFWVPWLETGSYKGTGWETVSIPIADCKWGGDGVEDLGMPKSFGQLCITIHNRGAEMYGGTPCSPVILLDNIRVVPGE